MIDQHIKTMRDFVEGVHEGEWVYGSKEQALTSLAAIEQAMREPVACVSATDLKKLKKSKAADMCVRAFPPPAVGTSEIALYLAAPPAQQAGYTAGDMASAAAQGFRDGQAAQPTYDVSATQDPRGTFVTIYADGGVVWSGVVEQTQPSDIPAEGSLPAGIGMVLAQQAQAEAVPADESKWAAYVAGVIGCYLKEPDNSPKVAAIAGIIERRMWASAHQPLKIAAWRGVHVEGDYLYYDEFPEELTAEQRRQLHLKPLYEGAAPKQAEVVPK